MFTETGRIVFLGDIRQGVSSRTGEPWASQLVVIETDERYARKIAGTINKQSQIDNAKLKLGEYVTLKLEARSHEYNSNWFVDLDIFDVLTNGVSRFVVSATALNQ